jgi:FkbM family methyltransferase
MNSVCSILRKVKSFLYSFKESDQLIYAQNHWIEIFERPEISPLKKDKIYEQETTLFIRNYLNKGDTVWDVGANIGYFTLEFARSVGPGGKVLSFEPHPEIFKVLQLNVSRNRYQNINLQNVACGEETSISKLYFSTENEGNHKIVENSSSNDSVDTKVVKLSTYLETHAPRLIKMDIEGAELLALKGLGADYLKNNSVDFVIEYHPYEMSFFNIEGEELLDFFIEAGYKFRNLATGSFPIIDKHSILKSYTKEERGITNLFCSKTID